MSHFGAILVLYEFFQRKVWIVHKKSLSLQSVTTNHRCIRTSIIHEVCGNQSRPESSLFGNGVTPRSGLKDEGITMTSRGHVVINMIIVEYDYDKGSV